MNNTRPTCINHGCNTHVIPMRGKISDANPRWRVHCGDCQKASYGGKPHKPGVTPFKTGKCSNTDGHLGFDCPVNWNGLPVWSKGLTEVDHVDGDFTNNNLDNLDELCSICHQLKGQWSGDFDNTRKNNNDCVKITVNKNRPSAKLQFDKLFEI